MSRPYFVTISLFGLSDHLDDIAEYAEGKLDRTPLSLTELRAFEMGYLQAIRDVRDYTGDEDNQKKIDKSFLWTKEKEAEYYANSSEEKEEEGKTESEPPPASTP
jgi:hypothetical protein